MDQTLLTTKLYFPSIRSPFVSRPQLVERLQNGLTSRLTLISAPAGYGKTTLMSEWRSGAGCDYSTAWLSLDNDDNDPTLFLTYFIATLATLKSGFGEIALDLLQSSPPLSTQVILTSLINELGEIDKSFTLVLDDYHVITNHPIHEAVTYLLDYLPSQMHLVILTRADPPLPLSRLRSRNQLVEIRATDLRFTSKEATEFLRQIMGVSITTDQVNTLETRTEGWVAGLQLAALSMQGQDDLQVFISSFSGSQHYILDFLVEEVLNHQPKEVREFLLRTSILDRLSAPLCDVLADNADSQAMLERLEHANLFLTSLDNEQRWYRYHHLFADVLRNRLGQTIPATVPDLHHRAAKWYESNHMTPEALNHALAAGEMEYAASLVEQNALSMILRGELTILSNWIESVASKSSSRPWLSIWLAWVFVQTSQQEKAEAVLDKIGQGNCSTLTPEALLELQGNIAAIRAHIAVYRGDTASTIAYAQQALDFLPESNLSIRGFTILVLGSSYLLGGDLKRAGHYLAEARRIGKASGNLHVAVLSTFMLANLLVDQGQLHGAAEISREALQLSTTSSGQPLPVAARAYSGLSRVYYEWNDLDAVQRFSNQCIDLAKRWGNYNALFTTCITLGKVNQARGDLAGAQASLDEAVQLMHDYKLAPGSAGSVEIFQVRLWLANDNLMAATNWVERNGYKVEDTVPPLSEAQYLTFARVLLAQNKVNSTLTLLDQLLITAESTGKIGTVIEILILQALAYQKIDDIPQALKAFECALTLAQTEGFLRIFLDEGKPIVTLLQYAAKKGVYSAYIKKLLSVASPGGTTALSSQLLIEPLSNRELEVLQRVAEGKSNQQIAGALFITSGTVKKHLNNIFGKLSVQSRTQCVARARELNIL